jgi:hypothetical protein
MESEPNLEGLVGKLESKKLYEITQELIDGNISFEECMMMTEQQWKDIANNRMKGIAIYNYLNPSKSIFV